MKFSLESLLYFRSYFDGCNGNSSPNPWDLFLFIIILQHDWDKAGLIVQDTSVIQKRFLHVLWSFLKSI